MALFSSGSFGLCSLTNSVAFAAGSARAHQGSSGAGCGHIIAVRGLHTGCPVPRLACHPRNKSHFPSSRALGAGGLRAGSCRYSKHGLSQLNQSVFRGSHLPESWARSSSFQDRSKGNSTTGRPGVATAAWGINYVKDRVKDSVKNVQDSVRTRFPIFAQPGALGVAGRKQRGKRKPSVDYVTKLLERRPHRVEPSVLVDGRLVHAEAAKEMNTSATRKLASSATASVTGVRQRKEGPLEGPAEEGQEAGGSKPVFLNDLLRQYKGELYVPEEAFLQKPDADMAEFARELRRAPEMRLGTFMHHVRRQNVQEVASQRVYTEAGTLSPRARDHLVTLKRAIRDLTGETLPKTWRIRIRPQELTRIYNGAQRELERPVKAYVGVPAVAPTPQASTLSVRAVKEVALLAAATFSFLAFAVAAAGYAAMAVGQALAVALAAVSLPLVGVLAVPAGAVALALGALALVLFVVVWMPGRLIFGPRFVTLVGRLIAGVPQLPQATLAAGKRVVAGLWDVLQNDVLVPLQLRLSLPAVQHAAPVLGPMGERLTTAQLDKAIWEGYYQMFWDNIQVNLNGILVIGFVMSCMAALSKYTLTRNVRNPHMWDIWQAIEFGQSKAAAKVEGGTGVKFADVAGIDPVVEELKELVEYLKNPELFKERGTTPPHGVLLHGPPGNGKTMVAKAIAGEAGVPFYQMAGPEFVEILVGVGSARVRDLFKRARVNKPSVVFIDEIDALGIARGGSPGEADSPMFDSGMQERETTLNQLLIELDGFDTGKGVIFLAATNRMDMLDPALLRPGRFDRRIKVEPPKLKGRIEVLKVHASKAKVDPKLDFEAFAKVLVGWPGAALAQVIEQSATFAIRRNAPFIQARDMESAIQRITLGALPTHQNLEAPPVLERRAAQEVGIAGMTLLLQRLEGAELERPVRASIKPRGHIKSETFFVRDGDRERWFVSRRNLHQRMQVLLAGRAVEEVLWGAHGTTQITNSYLPDATWLAFKIVSVWSLGEKVVMNAMPMPWEALRGQSASGPDLYFEGGLYENYNFDDTHIGHGTTRETVAMAKELLDKDYAAALELLSEYRVALIKAVHHLLEMGEISAEELEALFDEYPAGSPMELVESYEMHGEFLPLPSETPALLEARASAAPSVDMDRTYTEMVA